MEVKFTKEQEELLLKNYAKICVRGDKLSYADKAMAKAFLLECIDDMLSTEVSNKLREEMMSDTIKATVEIITE